MVIRSELIKRIAAKTHFSSQKKIEEGVNFIIDFMANSLCSGKRIEIRGFGSFDLRCQAPRRVRNPKTGEKLTELMPVTYKVYFKSGKELRKQIDASKNIPIKNKPNNIKSQN